MTISEIDVAREIIDDYFLIRKMLFKLKRSNWEEWTLNTLTLLPYYWCPKCHSE